VWQLKTNNWKTSNIDFLGLSETWLTCLSPEALIVMPGYDVFRKDRDHGKIGGVSLYVKSTKKFKQIEWLKKTDNECVDVNNLKLHLV